MYSGRIKSRVMKVISAGVLFVFLCVTITPREALAGRSRAGGGKPAKFSWENFGISLGITVGSAVFSSVASGAWDFAKGAAGYTSPVFSGASPFATVGNTILNPVKSTLLTGKELFTSVKPWTTGLKSLTSFKTIAPTIAQGFKTYVVTNQLNRAVGSIGNYKDWDPEVTFLASSLISGGAVGALNPGMALGGNKYVNALSGWDVLKGAAVGVGASGARAGTIIGIDGRKISRGDDVGLEAQIAGLFVGDTVTQMGRALANPATYNSKVEGDFKQVDNKPSLENRDAHPDKSWLDQKAGSTTIAHNRSSNPADDTISSLIREDEFYTMPESSTSSDPGIKNAKAIYKPIEHTTMDGVNSYGQGIPDYEFDAKYTENSRFEVKQTAPDTFRVTDTQANVSPGNVLYRTLVKAPIIDTLSSHQWPATASVTMGMLVADKMEDKDAASIVKAVAQSFGYNMLKTASLSLGTGLDMANLSWISEDNKSDMRQARLERVDAWRSIGVNQHMSNFKAKAESTRQRFEKKLEGINDPDERELVRQDYQKELGGLSIAGGREIKLSIAESRELGRMQNKMNSLTNESDLPLLGRERDSAIVQERAYAQHVIGMGKQGDRELSVSEGLKEVGTSKPQFASRQIGGALRSNIFEGAVTGGAEMMVNSLLKEDAQNVANNERTSSTFKQIIVPYVSNMISSVLRGTARHYHQQYVDNKSREYPIPPEARDSRQALSPAVLESVRQSSRDLFAGALSFGMPLKDSQDFGSPYSGILPQQVSSNAFMNYVGTVQSLTSKKGGLREVIVYSAERANRGAIASNLSGALRQVRGVSGVFHMQPEGLPIYPQNAPKDAPKIDDITLDISKSTDDLKP